MSVKNIYLAKVTLFFFMSALLFPSSAFSSSSNNTDVSYCIDPSWMPYEAMENSQHIGISSGYLDLIKQYTNLSFNLVETSSWPETITFLKEARCDLVLMLNKTPKRQEYLSFSDVYYRSPNVLVSLREQPFIQDLSSLGEKRLGVVENYRITEYIEQYFPDIQKVYVSSEDEGLRQVANKQVDILVGSMLSLNAKAQQYGYGNLKVAGWAGPEDQLRVGVIKGKEALLPLINDAIAQITEAQRITIMKKWNNVKIIKETDYWLLFQLGLVVLIITFVLVLRQRQLNQFNRLLNNKNEELELVTSVLEKANQDLEYISFHDQLTDLYNRSYFTQYIKDKIHVIKRSKTPASLMLVDIDHYKKINDELGHNVGDRVLKELVDVFNSVVRQSDTIARWGGDEFVILLPETSLESAQKLAKRMLETVREYPFENVGKVTVSIGIAEYPEESDFHNWFEKTDEALYRAKGAGRDQACS
jgi:diguanylate cyclase (GGDEF)-like protein